MSQNLPAIQVQVSLSDGAAIKKFLEELEAVAQACTLSTTPAPQPEPIAEPESTAHKTETYLDAIAQKYSFAPPRSNFHKCDESGQLHKTPNCPTPKTIVSSGIMWQLNKTCRAFLTSISTIQRKQ